jgi:hypothetical protein
MVKGYFSYLLRLWQVSAGGGTVWRASVEEIPTGERKDFADLDGLVAYLREQTKASSPPEEAEARGKSIPGDGAAPPGGEGS